MLPVREAFKQMNCPHCQKELLENHSGNYCEFCGKDFEPGISSMGQSDSTPLTPVKFRPEIFFLVLLAPPLLTALTAWLIHTPNQSTSVAIGFFGGGAAGIACGIMIGLRLGKTLSRRCGFCLLFSIVMVVVSITLCCFGCGLGGYQLRLN